MKEIILLIQQLSTLLNKSTKTIKKSEDSFKKPIDIPEADKQILEIISKIEALTELKDKKLAWAMLNNATRLVAAPKNVKKFNLINESNKKGLMEAYRKDIIVNGVWGGLVEADAIAKKFNIKCCVYLKIKKTKIVKICEIGQGEYGKLPNKKNQTLHLLYDRLHYNCVIVKDPGPFKLENGEKKQFQIEKIPKDNNCLFRAMACICNLEKIFFWKYDEENILKEMKKYREICSKMPEDVIIRALREIMWCPIGVGKNLKNVFGMTNWEKYYYRFQEEFKLTKTVKRIKHMGVKCIVNLGDAEKWLRAIRLQLKRDVKKFNWKQCQKKAMVNEIKFKNKIFVHLGLMVACIDDKELIVGVAANYHQSFQKTIEPWLYKGDNDKRIILHNTTDMHTERFLLVELHKHLIDNLISPKTIKIGFILETPMCNFKEYSCKKEPGCEPILKIFQKHWGNQKCKVESESIVYNEMNDIKNVLECNLEKLKMAKM